MDPTDAVFESPLATTLHETNLPELGDLYRGKVRDVYRREDSLVIITTDRVSAFDVVLGTIPFKGEILCAMAMAGFDATRDIVANHVLDAPDPNVLVARVCQPYPIEFVVRGYITGSLWRDYEAGTAGVYGIDWPKGLKRDQRLEATVVTPSTKAKTGHDQPISRAAIVEQGLMTARDFDEAAETALALYARGAQLARERALVLVDTKYELGRDREGRLTVIDEIHTPDCSRYWLSSEYEARFAKGAPQAMLDKENLRQWLIRERGYQGHGPAPELSAEIRHLLSRRYMEAYERLLGHPFSPQLGDVGQRIRANLERAGLLSA